MRVIINSDNALVVDALMRSMDIMWKDHPDPLLVFSGDIKAEEKLRKIYNFSKTYNLDYAKYLVLYDPCLFINPYMTSSLFNTCMNISSKMVDLEYNPININNVIKKNKLHKFYPERIILNTNDSNDIFYPSTQYMIKYNLKEDNDICNVMFLKGKRININPFLFREFDTPISNEEISITY